MGLLGPGDATPVPRSECSIPSWALFQANADLRTEIVMPGVNGRADHGGEPRIDQSLVAHDEKDTLFARVAGSGPLHQVQFAPLHGIWYSIVSKAPRLKRRA